MILAAKHFLVKSEKLSEAPFKNSHSKLEVWPRYTFSPCLWIWACSTTNASLEKPPVLICLIQGVTIHSRRWSELSSCGRTELPRPLLGNTSTTLKDANLGLCIQIWPKHRSDVRFRSTDKTVQLSQMQTAFCFHKLAYFQRGKKLSGELDFMDIKATIKTSTYSHFPSYKSTLLVPQDYEQKSSFQHIDTFSQKQYDCTAVLKKYEYKT